MKKLITLMMTLAFTLSCFFSISAYAAQDNQDNIIKPYASTYFSNYSAEIIPNRNGEITIRYSDQAKTPMTELGASKVVVQEKSGSAWTDKKTFKKSTTPSMVGSNRAVFSKDLSYSGTAGKEYRAIVTFYAKNSSGSDTKTYTYY